MKKNMGTADKTIRILVAAIIAILFFTNVISGILGIILLVLAGVFVLTSFISFCPLYTIFGLSTCPTKEKE
jgi:chromate transport protein ChrA